MPSIPLTRGLTTLVDEADLPILSLHRWLANDAGKGAYYAARFENGRIIYMHRQITGAMPGQIIDHKNRDPLDNRSLNLRVTDGTLNNANAKIERGISVFRGVSPNRRSAKRPWKAEITSRGRRYYLGTYASELEAARAYDLAAMTLFGEFARTNFLQ